MMKKNRLVLSIVLIMGVLAVGLLMTRTNSTLKGSDKNFAISDTASVVRIFMADMAGNQVDLQRIDSGGWSVNKDFKARQDGIQTLLKTMLNVAVVQPVPKSSRNTIVKSIASAGVKVEIYQEVYTIRLFNLLRMFPRVKCTRVYYVGSNTPDNHGTYMIMEGSESPFITFLPGFRGFIAIRYSPRVADWREHTVFNTQISDIKLVKIDFMEVPGFSWQADRSGERSFSLKHLSMNQFVNDYDTSRLLQVLSAFRDMRFEAIVTSFEKSKIDSIIHSPPFYTITLQDTKGKTTMVRTFHRVNPGDDVLEEEGNYQPYDKDRMYARINEDNELLLIQFFVFDSVLLPITAFLKQ